MFLRQKTITNIAKCFRTDINQNMVNNILTELIQMKLANCLLEVPILILKQHVCNFPLPKPLRREFTRNICLNSANMLKILR